MHNTKDSFALVPTGNSIIDPDGTSSTVQKELIETTIVTTSLTKFASLTLDSTQTLVTVDTKSSKEMGAHFISVKLTDSGGATCTY